jgi:anthranilate synthase component 2
MMLSSTTVNTGIGFLPIIIFSSRSRSRSSKSSKSSKAPVLHRNSTGDDRRKKALVQASDERRETDSDSDERPVIVIDNYDSFTYNLVQYLGDCGIKNPIVFKNDERTVEEIRKMNPKGIMVSPGPGRPEDSGISLEIVEKLGPEFGVFGVCMGHQCIGQVFGGTIERAPKGLMHGKSSKVFHKTECDTVLNGLSSPFNAARYHSLVISSENFPDAELENIAWTEDDVCMAVKHRRYPKIQGVQFHPESIITDNGLTIIKNWVKLINEV